MRLVVIESPYAGETETNLRYLRDCMADCLGRGEAPFASHGLYTQPGVLDDKKPEERELGIRGGFAWSKAAEATVVYTDRGISHGMKLGISQAALAGRPIEWRSIPIWSTGERFEASITLADVAKLFSPGPSVFDSLPLTEVSGPLVYPRWNDRSIEHPVRIVPNLEILNAH